MNSLLMAGHLTRMIVLISSLLVPYHEACMSTLPVNDLATTRTSLTPTSPVTLTTVSKQTTTTTSTTTTTTAITSCPSAVPLFFVGVPGPGDEAVEFMPSSTAAVGETIAVVCTAGTTGVRTGTEVYVTFDNGEEAIQNTDVYPRPGEFFEQFYMTCTPSGKWQVTIDATSGPLIPTPPRVGIKTGIVSIPGAILCI